MPEKRSTGRYCVDWIQAYLDYATENTESPIQYHVWTAIWCIGATLERRCWIPFGHLDIYPNMFVILVGPAAARKATPAKIITPMMRDVGVKLGTDTATKEGLYRAILRSQTRFVYGSEVIYQHAIALFSPELVVLTGHGNFEKITWLTDWWDAADTWQKETVYEGVKAVKNLCVSLLGLTTPDQLPKAIPMDAHEGGFVSRTLFIAARNRDKIVPFPTITDKMREQRRKLIHDLGMIKKMVGPFEVTEAAKEFFAAVYEEYAGLDMERTDNVRMSGYYGRRGTHLLKVAMALSASESDARVIELHHVQRADRLLRAMENDAQWIFDASGLSKRVKETAMLREAIRQLRVVRRSFLLEYFWRDMDARTISEVAVTLRDMHKINIVYDPDSRDYIYEWVDDQDYGAMPLPSERPKEELDAIMQDVLRPEVLADAAREVERELHQRGGDA